MIAAPDLLVVGGLSIDRFPDGATVPGGSVLHAARAVVAARGRVATIAVVGGEPDAQAGVAELARLGPSRPHRGGATIRFAIDERGAHRSLTLEAAGAPLDLEADEISRFGASAVLLAPIAGEIDAAGARAARGAPIKVASLQGWLRTLAPGQVVAALPVASMSSDLASELASFDLLMASTDDLVADAPSPDAQLDALRKRFGSRPTLFVTDGARGAYVDQTEKGRVLIAGHGVVSANTVGAGDAFAGLMAMQLGRGVDPVAAATDAAARVADLLAGSG
jgi:sugar/nucleoside kinase (ribokinase family)